MRSNEKIKVKVDYPIDRGVLGLYELEVTRIITVENLFKIIKNQIDVDHMEDMHITHLRGDSIHKLYSQKDRGNVYLFADSKLSLVCANCNMLVDNF